MPDTLYYDGQCPLCIREMDRLRTLKSDDLELRDIHALADEPGLPDRDTLLRELHLRRGDELVTGIDANVAVWQYTRYGGLWRWLTWPIFRPIARAAYDRWARWRYERLYGRDSTGGPAA